MVPMFIRIFGSHSSVTNSPVKGSSIIALTNLPSRLIANNGEIVGLFTTQVLKDSVVLF